MKTATTFRPRKFGPAGFNKKSKPAVRCRRRFFTLIELLVVIGIIAILLTILLPGLKKARETTKKIACTSNLTQIGKSMHMYANDYDGWPPEWVRNTATSGYYSYWQHRLGPYLGVRIFDGQFYKGSAFLCPSRIGTSTTGMTVECYDPHSHFYSSYGPNYFKTTPYKPLASTKSPTQTMFACDVVGRGRSAYPYDDITHELNPDPIHSQGTNIAYFDGHAGWIKYTDIPITGGANGFYKSGCRNSNHNFWDEDYDGVSD
jgi:prepilin-type processing-associated H-X9-DG protein/prepilin-type N-terminal cleavage/methylation domain-containing protein